MKLTDINENSIPTPDEAGNRVKALLAKHKGKPGLPTVPGNDHARNAYHADQDRAEQQQRDDRATANEEQINELDMGTEKTWAAKAAKWRSEQPMDFKDPVATAKAERRAEREMNIRNKHGSKPPANEGISKDFPKTKAQLGITDARGPTWDFKEIANKLGVEPRMLNLIAHRIGGFPEAIPGLSSSVGSTKFYRRNEIKHWVNDNNVRDKIAQSMNEGSMGGINRSAPSNDVSYEKTLNGTKDTWRGQTVKVNELKDDSETLKNYKDKARNTVPTNMRQASNRIQGLRRVQDREDNARIDKDARAKGDPRVQESVEATYAAKLGKFVAEVLNEVSKDTLKSYVKKSSRDMSDRASGEGYKAAKKNADKPYNTADETPKEKKRQKGIDKATDKLADTEYGKKLKEFVNEAMANISGDEFGDIARAQHINAPKPNRKKSSYDLDYAGYTIRIVPSDNPKQATRWGIMKKGAEEFMKTGSATTEKDASADAEAWIKKQGSSNDQVSKPGTIDFNSDFSKQIIGSNDTFYATIDAGDGTPVLYVSTVPQSGFKKSHLGRSNPNSPSQLQTIALTPKEINNARLVNGGRYTLGAQLDGDTDIKVYELILHSTTQGVTDKQRIGRPGLTVARQ